MRDLRPKMFDEAENTHASQKLAVQMIAFIIVFAVIMLAEALIPSIISMGPLREEFIKQGYLEEGHNFTIAESMASATKIASQPKIMIPSLYCTLFGTLISILYVRAFEVRPVRSMGARKRRLVPHYLLGLAVGAAMMSIIVLLTIITGVSSISVSSSVNFGLIALFLGGFFIQGMSEEFIFRGYFMTTVGGSHHSAVAIGLSAVAFGLAHAGNPGFDLFVLFNLSLFGVFAALNIILFDDIWGACAIHSIWNFTQGNFYGISVSGTGNTESVLRTTAKSSSRLLTGGDFGIEGSIFTTIVLGAGVAILLYLLNKQQKEKAEQ